MDRTYDIFEIFPDGTMIWRASITGLDPAVRKFKELAHGGANEFRLMHLPTHTVIATTKNVPPQSKPPQQTPPQNA
jgi:hypothetical protein